MSEVAMYVYLLALELLGGVVWWKRFIHSTCALVERVSCVYPAVGEEAHTPYRRAYVEA